MKKVLVMGLVILMLVVTGCGKEENKNDTTEEYQTMSCYRNATTGNVRMEINAKVKHDGEYVKTVKTVEKIISDDESVLEYYEDMLTNMYAPYLELKYYDNEVAIEGNTLISRTEVDYSKVDTNKMIELDSSNALLIKDGKIKIEDIKELYETNTGLICE